MRELLADTVPDLLVRNLPRDLILSVEEAVQAGASRAYLASNGVDDGHRPHVIGQLRHFHINEAFYRALAAGGSKPTPIQGNAIITGRQGIFTLARFNCAAGVWNNGRRSRTRQQMSLANAALERLVQNDLFEISTPPTEGVVYFVGCFSRDLRISPEAPLSIQVAVPDRYMRQWLFREPVSEFLKRYADSTPAQQDNAVPTLKRKVGKKNEEGGSA